MSSIRIGRGHQLAIDKALRQFALLCRKYDRTLASDEQLENWRHDFEIVLAVGNLEAVGIEFFTADKTVISSFWITFDPVSGKVVDSANGVEVPFVPRGLVAGHRVLKRDRDSGKVATYRHLLKVSWTTADALQRANGETYRSEHASAITAGWSRGEFFAADLFRHRGVIHFVSPRGDWAKVMDEGEFLEVFVHINHVVTENGFKFEAGNRVSYFLVTTPRGPQGRNIRPI